jgi:tetrahydromethanopterin S-methyltransferase subunit E
MGNLHRMINKAVSGEPVAFGTWAGIAGSVAFVLMGSLQLPVIMSIAGGAVIAALVHTVYATTSHLGRIVSQSQFKPTIIPGCSYPTLRTNCWSWIYCIFLYCRIIIPDDFKLTWLCPSLRTALPGSTVGITIGAIGSSTGDVHYGAEREYQQYPFGGGIPVAIHGDITRNAELGARNSIDVV